MSVPNLLTVLKYSVFFSTYKTVLIYVSISNKKMSLQKCKESPATPTHLGNLSFITKLFISFSWKIIYCECEVPSNFFHLLVTIQIHILQNILYLTAFLLRSCKIDGCDFLYWLKPSFPAPSFLSIIVFSSEACLLIRTSLQSLQCDHFSF